MLRGFLSDCKAKLISWNNEAPLLIVPLYLLSSLLGIVLFVLLKPQTSLSRLLISLALLIMGIVVNFQITRKLLAQWLDNKKVSKIHTTRPSIENLDLPDRMLIFDGDGRYHMVIGRPTVPEAYPFPNVEGHFLHEIFEKEFADFCLEIIKTTLENNSAQIVEYSRSFEGINYALEAHVAPFLDHATGNRYVAWISRDIRQRRRIETSLLESEKRLRSFVQVLPDRVIIMDKNGRYHDVLRSQYDGDEIWRRGGVQGENVYDRFDQEFGDFCVAKVRETLEKQINLVFEYDFDAGTKIHHLEGRTVPYIDPMTGEQLVIWMSRDITEAKETRKALEDSELVLRTIVGALPDRTTIFDVNGVYLNVLQSALEKEGIASNLFNVRIGHSIHEYFHEKFASFCVEMLKKTAQENKMQIFEYPAPNDEFKFFEGRTIPFTNPRTGELNILWLSRDISERKQLEQQRLALALQEEKLEFFKQFVDNLTHDLKTPLTVIKTNLYLLQKGKDTASSEQRIIAIDAQVTLLRQMIDDMLMISRLDSFATMRQDTVDLQAILEKIVSSLRPNAEKKFQRLEFTSQAAHASIQVADSDLRRALTNLIDNAINYTPNEGEIRIGLEAKETEYRIIISDTGIGIKQEELPHIFERFYRSEAARFTAAGTGLGLAITRRIIELHQGTISVESVVNRGSKFTVHLPIQVPSPVKSPDF